jgi:hypothetical protein
MGNHYFVRSVDRDARAINFSSVLVSININIVVDLGPDYFMNVPGTVAILFAAK